MFGSRRRALKAFEAGIMADARQPHVEGAPTAPLPGLFTLELLPNHERMGGHSRRARPPQLPTPTPDNCRV